ncbi:hypothetical protein EVAR_46122_1 [Eumeta japonica]|uniref:Retroviral polymerase SH3-like domain-containing protein n=1 Tax=Eumeta variegata TaxID=151549 RepID=A0A4C1XNU0_EUMVA|nr:hypothetical protein EVAR_46122_1 [Eumeta japonica]
MTMNMDGNIKLVAERRDDLYYVEETNEEADIVEDKGGYPRETKGYRISLPEKAKYIICRDVKFIEDNVTTILKNQGVELLTTDDDSENKNEF